MWRHLLRKKRWVVMPLLAALVMPWLPGMMILCAPDVASESSPCLQQPLKKSDAPASKPACHEAAAKACIHCADILLAAISTSSTDTTPILALASRWESSATHLLPPAVYPASPLTPLESTLANRVLLI
jgi:hypothetical protein